MAKDMLKVLEDTLENQLKQPKVFQYAEALQEGVRPKQYLPLMSRTKCGMWCGREYKCDFPYFSLWSFFVLVYDSQRA